MKRTIINSLFAALALLSAASCHKEAQPASQNESDGSRLLVASFAADATRSTLDGLTPKWSAGDEVKLADAGTNSQVFTLVEGNPGENEAQIIDGGAKFAVTIPDGWNTAMIFGVYPASACNQFLSEDKIKIDIPVSQDGTFAGANICVAKTAGNTLSFQNATAILKIEGKASGISSIEIPATDIAGTYTISGIGSTLSAQKSSASDKITLSGMADSGPYYVAVAPVTVPENTKFPTRTASHMRLEAELPARLIPWQSTVFTISVAFCRTVPSLPFSASAPPKR